MKRKGVQPILMKMGKGLLAIAFLTVYLYPIVVLLFNSLKSKKELLRNPSGLPQQATLENFRDALDSMNYFTTIWNTVIVAGVTVAALLFVGSMAAYAICRKGGKYNIIYFLFMTGMMVPFEMRMMPLYMQIMNMGLMNTHTGVVCIYLGTLAPMTIFILTGFVKTIPRELEEAAYIDGASTYRTFFTIVVPLMKSSLVTVGITNAFAVWNDFLMPLLFLQSQDKKTLTVMLANFQGRYFNNWAMIFSGVCLIVLPVLIIYLCAQKHIVAGLTAGAVKG